MNPLWRNVLSVPCPLQACLAPAGERCKGTPLFDNKDWSACCPFHRLWFQARPLAENRADTWRRSVEKKRAGETAEERVERLARDRAKQRRRRRENYTGRVN
jgi:hypothetical protein